MRRWFVPLLLALGSIAAGPPPAKKKPEPPPLPPLNAKVVDFARAHVGRPVGDGICITLAAEALKVAGARPVRFGDREGNYTWGRLVDDPKDVLPGDILQFRDAVFDGKRYVTRRRYVTWHQEYPHHTAVVVKVEDGGKTLTVLHQNVALEGRPESEKGNVKENELRMDSLQKGGWVKAYRPEPPAPPGTDDPG